MGGAVLMGAASERDQAVTLNLADAVTKELFEAILEKFDLDHGTPSLRG
ncbi:hypothetical protein G7068_16295 [Leucobacter viscericola]|uniref:Uncharacterized protein n=1 Tax=Leucobacter viscericola TaxID=2714935 RepID=A0A6G7XJQ6_9MICO|nr:hypothetical protein [Leucobacter viscericola]QIK64608.1 hypothetical protein G7068_16295 [Leucobacter viscericola]